MDNGRKGKYDKNALVMDFSSCKMIPIECVNSETTGERKQKWMDKGKKVCLKKDTLNFLDSVSV